MPCGASTSIQLRVYHWVSWGLKALILLNLRIAMYRHFSSDGYNLVTF